MSHKTKVRDIAIIIIIVFIVTIVVYPLVFGTVPQPKNAPPVELPTGKAPAP